MEDEHQDHHPETSATPVSNQNLIIGIVMGAVVLLLLLLVISQQFGDIGDSGNSELADMRRKLKEEKKEMERRRIAGLSGFNASPEGLVTQIKTDVENLARLVNTSKTIGQNKTISQKKKIETVCQQLKKSLKQS